VDIFNYLMEYSDINQEEDSFGHNILHYAMIKNDVSLVKNLINIGIIINDSDINFAISKPCLNELIESDVFLSYFNRKNDPYILYKYMSNAKNKTKCVENLHIRGCNFNVIDKYYRTPLFYAFERFNIKLIILLIQHGADIMLVLKLFFYILVIVFTIFITLSLLNKIYKIIGNFLFYILFSILLFLLLKLQKNR